MSIELQKLVTICTFHALSYQAIRRHYKEAGFSIRPQVVADKEQLDYLRGAVRDYQYARMAADALKAVRSAKSEQPTPSNAPGYSAGEDALRATQHEANLEEKGVWKYLSDFVKRSWPQCWDALVGGCHAQGKEQKRRRSAASTRGRSAKCGKGITKDMRTVLAWPTKPAEFAESMLSRESSAAIGEPVDTAPAPDEDGPAQPQGRGTAPDQDFRMKLCTLIVDKLAPPNAAKLMRSRWKEDISATKVTKKAKEAKVFIGLQKCRGVRLDEFAKGTEQCEVWRRYQEALGHANALDFDDMLCVFRDLLVDERHSVQRRLRAAYTHVLVDEFQDNNRVPACIHTRTHRIRSGEVSSPNPRGAAVRQQPRPAGLRPGRRLCCCRTSADAQGEPTGTLPIRV